MSNKPLLSNNDSYLFISFIGLNQVGKSQEQVSMFLDETNLTDSKLNESEYSV